MMFTDNPEKYFPYSRVEIVHFPKGSSDPEFFEAPYITGPVPHLIRQTLLYLRTAVLKEKVRKIPGQAEAMRVWNYPYEALEEIVATSMYHRDYQTREPVEVRIYPDLIIVLNYGGPDRSIKTNAFKKGNVFPRRYRNRRLGDFLKELDLTEGKATGIPTIKKAMQSNGSPIVDFETGDDRSYFQVTIPVHPLFLPEAEDKAKIDHRIIDLTDRQKDVLNLIIKDNKVSIQVVAGKLGVNYSAIQKHFEILKENNVIERVGGTRGYWKVNIR